MTGRGEEVLATEYLYAVKEGHFDGDDSRFFVPARVIRFSILKKTPKRIYYVRLDDGIRQKTAYVDRLKLETDGEIYNHGAGDWWAPDFHLYLAPPATEAIQKPTLAELKAAMRAAHPDMGGSHEDFLRAHERYERAGAAEGSRATSAGKQTTPQEGDRVT